MAAALAAGVLVCGWASPARGTGSGQPEITTTEPAAPVVILALLPSEVKPTALVRAGMGSVGEWSTGIGAVLLDQSLLDITQGNRVDDVVYDHQLRPFQVSDRRISNWAGIRVRADSAPADIVPGLLGSTLRDSRIPVFFDPSAPGVAPVTTDRLGAFGQPIPPECSQVRCPGLSVLATGVAGLSELTRRLTDGDLLIALAAPSGGGNHGRLAAVGIAGAGYSGNLTSDSTRTDGYVLSTDVAPTILSRFGVRIPAAMNGERIRAEGKLDPAVVEDRAERMTVIPDRRGPVVILCLAAWIVIAAAGLLSTRARREALGWLALAFAYMPLMLLAGAALQPSAVAEALMIGIGAAALALLTLIVLRGWWALAIACAITVIAYAIDVVAGSGLTTLSLLGPNPIFGVRFYGIGNELEALIAVMVPVAVGAALSARALAGKPLSEGGGVCAFLGAALLGAVVFAAGRFGADVGAAIVLPVGGAVAAALVHGGSDGRRNAALVVAAPVIALATLALIDLVSGANAHLTRSVLDAGGAGDLADIAQRRVLLSAHDFGQAAGNPLFWVVVVGLAVALAQWRKIDAWLRPVPAARAGVIGACAAVVVGVLVNDSGATFLVLGSLALGASLAFAWAQAGTDP